LTLIFLIIFLIVSELLPRWLAITLGLLPALYISQALFFSAIVTRGAELVNPRFMALLTAQAEKPMAAPILAPLAPCLCMRLTVSNCSGVIQLNFGPAAYLCSGLYAGSPGIAAMSYLPVLMAASYVFRPWQ